MINKKVYINYVFSCSEVFLLFSVYFIGIKILEIKVVIIRYFVFYTSDYDSTKLDIIKVYETVFRLFTTWLFEVTISDDLIGKSKTNQIFRKKFFV